jgi:hypothetical protein
MTVYVDDEQIAWRGKVWCHLVADTLAELHEFADKLGLRREWFQSKSRYPHYDVTVSMRDRALRLGAVMGDRLTIYECAVRLQHEAAAMKRTQSIPQGSEASVQAA